MWGVASLKKWCRRGRGHLQQGLIELIRGNGVWVYPALGLESGETIDSSRKRSKGTHPVIEIKRGKKFGCEGAKHDTHAYAPEHGGLTNKTVIMKAHQSNA
jgi:hypothetical protein